MICQNTSVRRKCCWDTADRFHGSDDDLRQRFELYIQSALSAVKLADFQATCKNGDVIVSGMDRDPLADFSRLWLEGFRTTPAYILWRDSTDPVLFDLFEPKHPCDESVNAVSDLGLRLTGASVAKELMTEGLHDMNEQFAPARQAVTSALTSGSATFMRAINESRADARLAAIGGTVGSFFKWKPK